jgi:hypothetical protein
LAQTTTDGMIIGAADIPGYLPSGPFIDDRGNVVERCLR